MLMMMMMLMTKMIIPIMIITVILGDSEPGGDGGRRQKGNSENPLSLPAGHSQVRVVVVEFVVVVFYLWWAIFWRIRFA